MKGPAIGNVNRGGKFDRLLTRDVQANPLGKAISEIRDAEESDAPVFKPLR